MPQTPLTDQTVVGVTNAGAQFAPTVAALPGSSYVIVWLDSSRGAIYGQRYDSDGLRLGIEFQVSSPGPSPLFASVAGLDGGGFVVAWQYSSFSNADIHALRYDANGTPVGNEFTVNSNLPNEQLNVQVIGLDGGGFLFTWDTIVNDQFQDVSGRLYDSLGQPTGPDFTINTTLAGGQGASAIARLAGGGFVATWQSESSAGSGNYEIIGQRFGAGGAKVGGEFQVNISTAGNQVSNDVATLSDGSFVVTWLDPLPNNGGGRVLARHFDANGAPHGGEIVIDSQTGDQFAYTSVTALANGGYVVSWTDSGDANTADNNVSARAMAADDTPLDIAFGVSTPSVFNPVLPNGGSATLANGHVVFTWDGPSTNTSEDAYYRMYDITASAGNAPPVAKADAVTTNEATILAGNVFSDNGSGADSDADGPALSVSAVNGSGAAVGTQITLASGAHLTLNANGTFSYDPNHVFDTLAAPGSGATNSSAPDSFTYTLTGGGSATVSVTINGVDSNDRLLDTVGNDELIGGIGNDIYVVRNAGDTIVELAGGGTDTVETALAVYVLNAANVENLTGTSNAGQSLVGNGIDNVIIGGTGNDELQGGLGNDTYVVLNSGDTIVEQAGGGSDTVQTGLASYVLQAANVENLTGTSNAGQSLGGSSIDNVISGGTGNDEMQGGAGNDTYVVRNAGDTIVEQAGGGTDTIQTTLNAYQIGAANVENLTFIGSGDFFGAGNGGDNVITGGGGNDLLRGGLGADTLIGGAGSDSYLFDTALGGGNVDAVNGFVSGADRILLDNTVFTALSEGGLAPGAFVLGTSAQDSDDRIIYDAATGNLFYDADGNGAGAAVQFANLSGHPPIIASDFQVI